MTKIEFELYGALKQKLNKRNIKIDIETFDEDSVAFKNIISKLTKNQPELVSYFKKDLSPKDSLIVIINGADSKAFEDKKISLKAENKISLIPTIHGG